uniref:Catenin delta-2 n=1 Tax=Aceria tosichella TaxID=561515 RepID=A0A6G1SNX0_9ACAR
MVVTEPTNKSSDASVNHNNSHNNFDAPDNASLHVQQQEQLLTTINHNSNNMVNNSHQQQQHQQNDIITTNTPLSNNSNNNNHNNHHNDRSIINPQISESTYMNQKVSNYDIAYGSTRAPPVQNMQHPPPIPPPPVQLQSQPSLMTTTSAAMPHHVANSIPTEPVYGINRNGMIAFVAQQPTTLVPQMDMNGTETMWRDPELEEVITFLSNPDPIIRANSIAYLQHLTYGDDAMKQKTRLLGGIPILIDLLNRDMLEVKRNVCGALRNLSYGRKNDDNKRAIKDAQGIPPLVRALIDNPDNEIRELATSVLWNLSSCEEVKWSIIDDALNPLISVILVPYTAWFRANINSTQQFLPTVNETHWSTVFRNVTGVLRNISSAGAYARKQLRDCEGLIESLFFIINSSISRNDVENKLVENCVCILRNLSYRCQETQDPDYDKHFYNNNSQSDSATNSMQNSPSSPSSSANLTSSLMGQVSSKVVDNLGCFSFGRRSRSKLRSRSGLLSSLSRNNSSNQSDQGPSSSTQRSATILPPHHPSNLQANGQSSTMIRTSTQIDGLRGVGSSATLPSSGISNITSSNKSQQPSGKDLLWQPDVVKPYLALLSGCSNSETLEAAAGAIQNLAACFWQPSVEIRAAVRKERGLPVLVELLRMDRDRVVCVVATALRNLAIDQKNKELIGKYAMPDLVNKLTTTYNEQECPSSDNTIAAVLATLHEVISNNVDFVRSLYEAGGLNKLAFIVRNKTKYSARVQRFAAQVLLDMWKFTELREMYKKGGWKESHFIVRPQLNAKNSTYSVNSNTIERPIASQQADRSSSTRNLRAISATSVPQTMIQQNSDMFNSANTNQFYDAYPAYGGVQMTPLNGQVNNPNALYAQVDRQRKRNDMGQQQSTMIASNNC